MAELHVEVSGIQRWVAGGFTELKLVRGGSILLEELFQERLPQSIDQHFGCSGEWRSRSIPNSDPWQPVKVVSGSLTVLIADDDLDAVGSAVYQECRRFLSDLPIRISAVMDRRDVITFATPPAESSPPGAAPCSFSGEGAAADDLSLGSPASPVVIARHRALPDASRFPEAAFDMDEIGAATASARYQGYVAVIVADGDGIGERVAKAAERDEEALWKLNQRLFEETRCLFDTAREALQSDEGGEKPWNPVISGGDDMTLVVPADCGPDVALKLMSRPKLDDEEVMAVSAAVLVCASSFPFYVARQRAEEMLADAKAAARARAVGNEREPHVALEFEFGANRGTQRWGVSASPYTRPEFEALTTAAKATAGGISRSGLRQLVSAAEIGGRVAQREWQLLAGDDLAALAAAFGSANGSWADGRCPLGDLVDLVGLLEARP